MPTWTPNTARVRDNGFGRSRNGTAVTGLILHIADQAIGSSTENYVANANDRNSHPTYVIRVDGTVVGIVHPDRRPTSTYPGSIDQQSVTIEFDNVTRAPDYQISQAQKDAAVILLRHHYNESPRAGKGIVFNDPKNTQAGFFVGWHSQYRAVECPGRSVRDFTPELIQLAAGGSNPAPSVPSTPAPAPAPSSGKKSNATIADEVLAGKWGNGDTRKSRLRAAGYDYDAVMREVNAKLKSGGSKPSAPAASSGLPAGSAKFSVSAYQRFMRDNFPLYARHVVVDNKWGPQIAGVTKEYQKRKGLQRDGIVGAKQTLPALRADGFRG